MLTNVRSLFLKTRVKSYEYGFLGGGHLRPFKRALVDIMTSEKTLDVALAAAQVLFDALEQRRHRVAFSTPGSGSRRPELDVLEVPLKQPYYRQTWAPDRITVLFIGGIEIGLTLFELIEKVETINAGGKTLAVRDLLPSQLKIYSGDRFWRSTSEHASGRLGLFAYSPSGLSNWSKRWQESAAGEFNVMVPGVVADLEAVAPVLVKQIEEGRRRQEQRRLEWEESRRKERAEAERQRHIRNRQEARRDLLAAIAAWDEARSIADYFAAVVDKLEALPDDRSAALRERLRLAADLIGEVDPLQQLSLWKAPNER